jgi:4-amino-4-deoxy-L-arabinose transferase-like glycosyltransferase
MNMGSAVRQEHERTDPAVENHAVRFLVLALLAALLLFASLMGRGLAGYDDSYFAHEGKEMVRTGDWWNVRFNGEFILAQGPMFPWLEACSFQILGVNDRAAKVPSALLGFATILLMYFLTIELNGDSWLALMSMLVLASTQFFLKNASHAMTDVPFTFLFALAIFFYTKGLRKSSAYLVFMGFPLGLAMLMRSVVGLLALGIVLTHVLLTKRYKLLSSPRLICGVAIALVLPAIWYISQYQLHGAAFFVSHLQFLGSKLHAEGASGGWKTIFAYPLALLKYYWPWLPFLIAGFVMEARAASRAKDQTAILLIVWVLFVVVPFSLAETRYPRYIMAVFPAFTILSAIALHRWLPAARRKSLFNLACVVGIVATCLSFLLPPKARADEITKLASIAEANSPPGQRVLIYTYEDGRLDYLYQFLWYSNRYAQLADSLDDLGARLRRTQQATVIIDRQSYEKLLPLMTGKTPHILGESGNLMCFQSS